MREIAAIDTTPDNLLAEKNAPIIDDLRRVEAGKEEPKQLRENLFGGETLEHSMKIHLGTRERADVRERGKVDTRPEVGASGGFKEQ